MTKAIIPSSDGPDGVPAEVDLLRQLAGLPVRERYSAHQLVRFKTLDVTRDSTGRVTGTHEHYEEFEVIDEQGHWAK